MKPVTLLKVTFLHGCFSRCLNCTKLRKSSRMNIDGTPTLPPHHPHLFNKEEFLDVLIFSKKQVSENVVSGGW